MDMNDKGKQVGGESLEPFLKSFVYIVYFKIDTLNKN